VLESRLAPANLAVTVNSLADDPAGPAAGVVTLRDAINAVNSDNGDLASDPDTIGFAVAGTISLAADLPAITNPVLLDGSTQTGVTVDGRASTGVNSYQGYAVLVVSSAATVKRVTFTNGVLTVNAGGTLNVAGSLTLGDPAGDSTLAQNYGNLAVTGDLSLGDNGILNNGVSSTDQATCTVGGNLNVGVDGSVSNNGRSSLSVTGTLAMSDGGALTNGTASASGQTAHLQIGGSLTIGSFGSITTNGASTLTVTNNVALGTFGSVDNGAVHTDAATFTVGGSFSLDSSSSVNNQGTSVLTVTGGFTLGISGFVFNGTSNADAATLNIGGDLSVGASGGNTFVANKGASKLTVNGNFTVHGASPFVDNGTTATDSATLTVGGNFTLDPKSYLYDYGSSAFTVSGSFTLGAGSYFVDNGSLSVGGVFDPGSAASASSDIVAGTFTAKAGSSVTTDAATWKVLAGGVLNVATGARFTLAPGASLLNAGTFTTQAGSSVAVNLATFEVQAGGQLVVGGNFDVAAGSTLQVDGGIITHHGGVTIQGSLTVEGNLAASRLTTVVVDENGTLAASGAGQVNIQGTLLQWNNPADINSGTALGPVQLDAVATTLVGGSFVSVNGTFAYNPPSGTVLPGGPGRVLNVAFAPSDATNYAGASAQAIINVLPAKITPVTPTITVNAVNITYGTALDNGQLSGTATATVNGSTLSISGTFTFSDPSVAGTLLNAGDGQSEGVTFTPDDTTDYTTATGTVVVNVARADQTITVTQTAPASGVYGDTFTVSATASSGLPVSIAASGASSVASGGTGSAMVQVISGTGTAAVTFAQAGNANYNPATVVEEDMTAHKADQIITITQPAPATAAYGTIFPVAATASSGLTVTIAATGAGSVLSGGSDSATLQITSGTGTAAVTFAQAGDANYNPATVEEDVTAQKADQFIMATQAPATAIYGTSFPVAGGASSGLPVTITATGAGTVTLGGSGSAIVQMTSGTGTAAVIFSQAGNANYNAATLVEEDVTAQKANQVITVTQTAPASAVYGASFTVAANSSSGLPATIAATGAGTVSSGGTGSATVQMTSGTGTAAVTFSQSGNANYNPATVIEEDVTAQKANQVITVTQTAPASAAYGTSFTVAAITSSGLAVTITASGAGAISSGGSGSATVLMTSSTGTAAVTFSQAGNANYNSATGVVEQVAASKANQTLTVTQAPPAYAVEGMRFIVSASASSGLPVAIVAVGATWGADWNSAPITVISASGLGVIAVFQPGNANYNPVFTTLLVHVVSPGVTVLGSELWYVGIDTTPGRADNQVKIEPVGRSQTGSSGLAINGVSYNRAFTAIRIFGYNGNDNIKLAKTLTIPAVITDGNGYDNIEAGNNNMITLGNGNDRVKLGDGDNAVTVGNGNDTIQIGDGNNVIVAGNGTNSIEVGNGFNLVAAGLGQHTVKAGNGSNILIDGSVQLTQSGDSLAQVLYDWAVHGKTAANLASIRNRLAMTYNRTYANTLKAGSGLDWFWCAYGRDTTSFKATDVLD
jgi:hypothetical protein